MENLLKLYKACHLERQSLTLDLTHDKVCDWYLLIRHEDSDTDVVKIQHYDLGYLGAVGFQKLYEWFEENYEYIPKY